MKESDYRETAEDGVDSIAYNRSQEDNSEILLLLNFI